MTYSIAIGGISHETNTYHPERTVLDDFVIYQRLEIPSRFEHTNTSIGSMLAVSRLAGIPRTCSRKFPTLTA